MRIVSQSATQLVLAHRPVVVPAAAGLLVVAVLVDSLQSAASLGPEHWVGATAGVLVGALIAYLSALSSTVVFDAVTGEVRWHHPGWPGRARGAHPLADLTGIRLLGKTSEDRALGLALLTPGHSIPLTRHILQVGRPYEETAVAIREWLSDCGYEVPAA